MALNVSSLSSVFKSALTGLVLMVAATSCMQASARSRFNQSDVATPDTSGVVALADLPAGGRATFQAIVDGGSFRHDKDGSIFGNRERLLPAERRGYYREYTVDTPGSRDRGARRIVCGGAQSPPAACWYTADHYASFRRIAP